MKNTVDSALVALAKVCDGQLDQRLDASLSTEHPLYALFAAMNQVLVLLEDEQQRSISRRDELDEKRVTVELQSTALRKLSTPIMEIWEGVLCLPMVGALIPSRCAQMTEALLHAVGIHRARFVIVDVSGLDVLDAEAARGLTALTQTIRLLGTKCALTGIDPQGAQMLVSVGFEPRGVLTMPTQRAALQHFLSSYR